MVSNYSLSVCAVFLAQSYLWKIHEDQMDGNDSHASPQPPQTSYTYAAVPRIIWMLWFQGWGKAPGLCLDMLKTWRVYNPGWEIRTICSQCEFKP